MKTILLGLFLLICALAIQPALLSAAEEKPHAVIVNGTFRHSPERSMPLFAEELKRFGFDVTIVQGVRFADREDPRSKDSTSATTVDSLPGIEALAEADVAVFFMNWMQPDDREFAYIHDYITSGKPVVGFRSSNWAFRYPEGHKLNAWNYDFGRRVLGGRWLLHTWAGSSHQIIAGKYAEHPVMSHVKPEKIVSKSGLYVAQHEPDVFPLVMGTADVDGKGTRVRITESGTHIIPEEETTITAWTWKNEWGSKVFATTLGDPSVFSQESAVRIMLNGVCWAADHPLPTAEDEITTWNIERDL